MACPKRIAALLSDPLLVADLLYALFAARTKDALSDWLAESLGDLPLMKIKLWLINGFYHTREKDLIAYARRRCAEEYRNVTAR